MISTDVWKFPAVVNTLLNRVGIVVFRSISFVETPPTVSIESESGVTSIRIISAACDPATAGVPQIEVTFDIDANGIVQVSAKDLGTGRHQEITITASSNLSDAEIDRAIREAAEYEATDGQRKAYIDARSEADTLIRQVEVAYKEKKKAIDSGARHQIKSSLSYVKKLVSRTKPGNVSEEQAAELQRAAAELRSAAGVLGI